MRKKTRLALIGASLAVAGSGISIPFAGPAGATPAAAATVVNMAAGSQLANGGTAHVTGTGFPVHSADPTGVEIIECSDPGGLVANLPTDPSLGCEGATVSPSQINTSATGTVNTTYRVIGLSTGTGSSINCDAVNYCVLWMGVDYNTNFSDPTSTAFSAPFLVVPGVAPTITSPATASFPVWGTGSSFTVTTTGVNAPAIAESGALPAGITYTDNGNGTATFSGKPSAPGSSTVSLLASNGFGTPASQTLTIFTGFELPAQSLPPATTGVPYNGTLLAPLGGTGPYKWKVKGLPKGLTADKGTGAISGTPILKKSTKLGSYSVTVTVQDSKVKSSPKHPNPNGHGKESATQTVTLVLS